METFRKSMKRGWYAGFVMYTAVMVTLIFLTLVFDVKA